MKFKVGRDIDVSGTCLQGYVATTYNKLLYVLGEPTYRNGDGSTCEWALEFEDGSVVTIYDWKTKETPTKVYDWHVGGHSSKAVFLAGMILESNCSL
jgi:hypothetical protein